MTTLVWTKRVRRHWTGFAGSAILGIFLLAAVFAPLIAPSDPNEVDLSADLLGPGAQHLLGTDVVGRDIFSRLIYGARSTLGLAVPVALMVTAIGIVVGLAAGYFGGWIDTVISAVLNALVALPGLILSLAILALLGPGTFSLLIALTLAGWAGFARVVRGPVIVLRQSGYVEAATAAGASDFHILRRHLLPNILGPVVVLATLDLGSIVLAIAALSFLGLGDRPPAAEWGAMLNDGRVYFRLHPHLMVMPGVCIFSLVLGANLLGDSLRDILDPTTYRR
jgi:peptide/nickel transport system permease protein